MADYEYEAGKDAARVNRSFYQAFRDLDLEAMSTVWLADDSVRCIHPGWDLITGFPAVMTSWCAIFSNTESLMIDISDVSVQIVAEMAWVTNVEMVRAVADGAATVGRVLATNLYRFDDGAWRMVLHHASPVHQRLPS